VSGAGAGVGPAGGGVPAKAVADVVVVEDRTKGSRSDEGFLRVRRLVLRTVWADGTTSKPYPCDVVSRSRTDAVAIVLYDVRIEGARRRPWVALKTGLRAPIFLRRHARLVQPDTRRYAVLAEIVAGMIEETDGGPRGVDDRAVHEAREEAGTTLAVEDVEPLGAESFPSPGVTDEKVHFRAARAPLDRRLAPKGDGSEMEAGGGVVVLPLDDALAACRSGEIPDMKTELALQRLADRLGWIPSLAAFASELPPPWPARWSPPGLSASGAPGGAR
jgi:ADP-ribose pyrophosphatase